MIAADNPDLPLSLIEGILEAREELKAGLGQPYQWGVLDGPVAERENSERTRGETNPETTRSLARDRRATACLKPLTHAYDSQRE